jgi:hypothetical protein
MKPDMFFKMEEVALFKEMARLDAELQAMIEADPELEEIYVEELGEAPGSVVYLPRAPTPEDWAKAAKLAKQK